MEIKLMHKPFIFLNVIIITTILFFAGPLSAQRIGTSKTVDKGFHRSYKYHVNSCNSNSLKACIMSKNKYQHRNKVQENHEGRYDHKDSAGPAWLSDPDIFSGTPISSPFYK
jgi:hypothetical protein